MFSLHIHTRALSVSASLALSVSHTHAQAGRQEQARKNRQGQARTGAGGKKRESARRGGSLKRAAERCRARQKVADSGSARKQMKWWKRGNPRNVREIAISCVLFFALSTAINFYIFPGSDLVGAAEVALVETVILFLLGYSTLVRSRRPKV